MSLFAATSFSALIAKRNSGELSPQNILDLSSKRIGETEDKISAFEYLAIDKVAITKDLPLSGVAVGVKDIFDTYDMPTTYGSSIYKDYQPKTDAAIVAKLREKGASVIGKTTTTEFAFFKPTKTKNPNNLEYSPGGSSAGSAAAVAAGMIPIGIGTQTGGSVIRPASFCGVAGFKPSYRLLPTVGMKYFSQNLDTTGVFGKTIPDIAHFLSLLTDRDLNIDAIETRDIKIGIYKSAILNEASHEMLDAVNKIAEIARNIGCTVIAITEPDELQKAYEAHSVIQCFEASQACASDYHLFKDQMSEKLYTTIEEGLATTPEVYDIARRASKKARRQTQSIFSQVDILIAPSAPSFAPIGFDSTGVATFNKLWTLLGTPTANIAGLTAQNGMPLGVQAIGQFGADKKLLTIASKLEEAINQ